MYPVCANTEQETVSASKHLCSEQFSGHRGGGETEAARKGGHGPGSASRRVEKLGGRNEEPGPWSTLPLKLFQERWLCFGVMNGSCSLLFFPFFFVCVCVGEVMVGEEGPSLEHQWESPRNDKYPCSSSVRSHTTKESCRRCFDKG